MNKNITVVGVIAAGLYLLSQGKKATKVVAKKKAPQRLKRKYPKPHPYIKPKVKKIISKKKVAYNKPKIKKVVAKKKAIYNKPKIKKAVAKKKAIYNKPKIKKAAAKKIITLKSTKPQKKKKNKNFHHIA